MAIDLRITLCQVAYHINNGGITRNRPFDHVRKYLNHALIKCKAADLSQGVRIDCVGLIFLHRGGIFWHGVYFDLQAKQKGVHCIDRSEERRVGKECESRWEVWR